MQGVPFRTEFPEQTAQRIADVIERSQWIGFSASGSPEHMSALQPVPPVYAAPPTYAAPAPTYAPAPASTNPSGQGSDKAATAPIKKRNYKWLIVLAAIVALGALLVRGCWLLWPLLTNKTVELNENVTKGDYVSFGSYPQTKNGTEKPIKWRVLDVENGNALLISEYLLDVKPYHATDEDVTWEQCTLRDWLNHEFFNMAFSSEEQGRIQPRTNDNPDNPRYGTKGCDATEDRVFCLSIPEANTYFKGDDEFISDDNRKAKPTAYAIKNGADVSFHDTCSWWLRSPGINSHSASAVNDWGNVSIIGNISNDAECCIRPVILVSLKTAQTDGDDSVVALDSNVSPSDLVFFGSYPQKADGKQKQAIKWRVLAVEDGKALMISEYLLDTKPYHAVEREITWKDCSLRDWLNNEFYQTAFSKEEKSRITRRSNQNPDHPTYGGKGGEPTEDYVFCLSLPEAEDIFDSDEDRKAKPTEYTKKKRVFVSDDGTSAWWLRSPSSNDAAMIISIDGSTTYGRFVDVDGICVRPVILVSL